MFGEYEEDSHTSAKNVFKRTKMPLKQEKLPLVNSLQTTEGTTIVQAPSINLNSKKGKRKAVRLFVVVGSSSSSSSDETDPYQ